ncbi:MAG: deoxyribose-phosphate aldolase [Bacteroidales bacterium]|nr:deoxyribose-phosphate aldolase [Bacteroidales bacterium]
MRKFDLKVVQQDIKTIIDQSQDLYNSKTLKNIFSLIDLTSLKSTDHSTSIKSMVEKVNRFSEFYPEMPSVAAICVYPNMVETVRKNLKIDDIQLAAVSAGFPSSQTFTSIKAAETEIAVEKGADEIDIVIALGAFLNKEFDFVADEISIVKSVMADAHLKVILESGLIPDLNQVYQASMLSINAGADFIKTSTGKENPAATLEAIYAMCHAIADHYKSTGKKIGLKPAGGISNSKEAIAFYAVVKHILGEEWLNNSLFRIGASKLANDIIHAIENIENKTISKDYF